MEANLSGAGLLTKLAALADAQGVKASSGDGRTLAGTQEAITSKWFLGGRKVTYRMRCEVDEPARIVRFREETADSSWGVPPPTLTVEKTAQSGTRVSTSRSDQSAAGGGHLDFGGLRDDVEPRAAAAGSSCSNRGGAPSLAEMRPRAI